MFITRSLYEHLKFEVTEVLKNALGSGHLVRVFEFSHGGRVKMIIEIHVGQ